MKPDLKLLSKSFLNPMDSLLHFVTQAIRDAVFIIPRRSQISQLHRCIIQYRLSKAIEYGGS